MLTLLALTFIDFPFVFNKLRLANLVPSSGRIRHDDGEKRAPCTDLGSTVKVNIETIVHGPETQHLWKYPSSTNPNHCLGA